MIYRYSPTAFLIYTYVSIRKRLRHNFLFNDYILIILIHVARMSAMGLLGVKSGAVPDTYGAMLIHN